jgi:anti-sigma regulatory factor (Ser/Thr protein kinase)
MEVIRGALNVSFTMDDASRVGQARRHAESLAQQAGLDPVHAGRIALVITELGSNLVRHASSGTLLIAWKPERAEMEIVAIDRGPGIADVARSLGDGYSTGGTPGTGLGAVQRLASEFHLHSVVPDGTVMVARVRPANAPPLPAHGIVAAGLSVALVGERVCGDAWAVAFDSGGASLVVADGLGHGPDAAEASQAALDVFAGNPQADPRAAITAIHARLRSTRGAAVTVLQLDRQAALVRSCGAGNVTTRLVSGDSDRTVLTQHGTAGLQIRTPEEVRLPWPPHALLVAHSDGLETRWTPQRLLPVLARDPMLVAALLLRDHSRGRDDATVVVVRRED